MRMIAVASLVAFLFIGSAAPTRAGDGPVVRDLGDDVVLPDKVTLDGFRLQAGDPLGLLPWMDAFQVNSLGLDKIDVWACDFGSTTASSIVKTLDAEVVPYFTTHSRGRITVDFVARGQASGGEQACFDHAAANPGPGANGVMIVVPGAGGIGSPGDPGTTSFPQNGRWSIVGGLFWLSSTAAHEYGHMQWWPHSFTKKSADEYDNALDLMSGNYGKGDVGTGTWPDPYDTAVINRYAAGWIDADQVRIIGPSGGTFRLERSSGNGIQMLVIRSGAKYYTLGARTRSTYDPIPSIWQGVELYEVTPCPYADPYDCLDDYRFQLGFREVVPFGRVPFDYSDPAAYDRPLPHVIRAGGSKEVGGRAVKVSAASGGAYNVTIAAICDAMFTDICGSTFRPDIEWLSATGITKGCTSTTYCPNASVTRGQMAAFLHRALNEE
jgi:S-layer homology domain